MTKEELEKQLIDLRLTELESREEIIALLTHCNDHQIWKDFGFRSLTAYMQNRLSYRADEARAIAIRAGGIVTTASLKVADPSVQQRIDTLAAWRRTKARREGIAAYRILSNRTLMALAEQNPESEEKLLDVPGIGMMKKNYFGSELLQVLRPQ